MISELMNENETLFVPLLSVFFSLSFSSFFLAVAGGSGLRVLTDIPVTDPTVSFFSLFFLLCLRVW